MNKDIEITFVLRGILPVLTALILTLSLSCTTQEFPFEDYDYTLDSLEIGIAFPSVRTPSELSETITAMTDLGTDWARIGFDWSFREPSEDTYSWDALANRLNAFADAGIKVLLTVETHSWPDWLPVDAEHDDSVTLAQFRELMADFLTAYGDKVARIQLGNEWNWEIDDYLNGSEEAFISYTNILSEEVTNYRTANSSSTPTLVLGSFSARHMLAYDQGLATEVTIEGQSVFEDQVAEYAALPASERMTVRVENILSNTNVEMLDIHFYDDNDDWSKHMQAFRTAAQNSGLDYSIPVIVSEFGGPWPERLYDELGRPSEYDLASRLPGYMHTLDSLDVEEVYFFKLKEGSTDIQHPDSYLLDSSGNKAFAYGVIKRFLSMN